MLRLTSDLGTEGFSSSYRRAICLQLGRWSGSLLGCGDPRSHNLCSSMRGLSSVTRGCRTFMQGTSCRHPGNVKLVPEVRCRLSGQQGGVAVDYGELVKDMRCGLRVLGQVLGSTWWDWTSGSAPIFWRWNGLEHKQAARDGMRIFVQAPLPRSRRGANPPRFDTTTRQLVSSKMSKMIDKSYLELGRIHTHLHFFAVPKGDHDICVVFDGTSSGLNETLWSQTSFSLPRGTHPSCYRLTRGWLMWILENSSIISSRMRESAVMRVWIQNRWNPSSPLFVVTPRSVH